MPARSSASLGRVRRRDARDHAGALVQRDGVGRDLGAGVAVLLVGEACAGARGSLDDAPRSRQVRRRSTASGVNATRVSPAACSCGTPTTIAGVSIGP